ncbi:MAG TPA: thioredoxin domain-containing protein [Steroidobacteraceae bacterium]|nr:thioredoxin domain-containing protein [Steroidobacteraceae bacterium]
MLTGAGAAGALVLALALAASTLGAGAARAQNGAAPTAEVRLKLEPGEPALGRSDAPLTMVEFTDYQCPYCRRFQAEAWPRLKRDYIDTGKLRYTARDLPLGFHASAGPAAEAAHCAGEQGKFWDMHAALLAGAMDFPQGGIERRARALKLDMARFGECVARGKYAELIAAHAREADAAGIDGTPGFIVGRAAAGVLDGVRVEGALPYGEFAGLLNELLAGN